MPAVHGGDAVHLADALRRDRKHRLSAVGRELVASGAIYDRLWQQRSDQLQQAATLLARDFGFRSALATGDRATALSAIANLKARLNVGEAYVVNVDGSVIGTNDPAARKELSALWGPLDAGKLIGVATIGGHAKQVVAAPILAPNLFGWVLFAVDLDARQMRSLEGLSPIVLDAGIVARHAGADWQRVTGDFSQLDQGSVEAISGHLDVKKSFELKLGPETSFSLAKSLPTLSEEDQAALLLLYPKSAAMAPYRPLQGTVALLALVGLGCVIFMTWRTAARITQPLAQLDEAVGKFAAGERHEVMIGGEDELARLATSFNNMVREIDEREKHIAHLAFNDVLTGLPNRTMFQKQAEHFLGLVRSGGHKLALFCIDLDNFKSVNDTLGHAVGDAMLVAVAGRPPAGRAAQLRRPSGRRRVRHRPARHRAARGNRSARPRSHRRDPRTARHRRPRDRAGRQHRDRAGRMRRDRRRHAPAQRRPRPLSRQGRRARRLLLFRGTSQRPRPGPPPDRDGPAQGHRGWRVRALFPAALRHEEQSHRLLRALIRWHHPERGMVSPGEFIPIAEDSGLIVPIGAWAMREACAQAVSWPEHIRVAVNVSSVQFRRKGLSDVVLQALTQSGLAPSRLEIEITESIFLDSGEETLKLLHGLRALGIRIALDDFGTGYSSLSYLQAFPFDKIKIDRSFIQNLLTRPGAVAVVRAITDLADALGMETTAEGVEETGQLAELRAQGCTSVQGFLFSRPVNAQAVMEMLGTEAGSEAKVA